MSDFSSGYVPEEYKTGATLFEEDDYAVRIEAVNEKYSNSGNLMRVVTLAVKGKGTTIDFFIVKNEYFNSSVTKFFDCFGIRLGDFNIGSWVGKIGKAHIAPEKYTGTDGKEYTSMKIKWLVVEKQPDHSKPMGQRSQTEPVYNQPTTKKEEKFVDDLPYDDENIPF